MALKRWRVRHRGKNEYILALYLELTTPTKEHRAGNIGAMTKKEAVTAIADALLLSDHDISARLRTARHAKVPLA